MYSSANSTKHQTTNCYAGWRALMNTTINLHIKIYHTQILGKE